LRGAEPTHTHNPAEAIDSQGFENQIKRFLKKGREGREREIVTGADRKRWL
jgi:hypothetical protein